MLLGKGSGGVIPFCKSSLIHYGHGSTVLVDFGLHNLQLDSWDDPSFYVLIWDLWPYISIQYIKFGGQLSISEGWFGIGDDGQSIELHCPSPQSSVKIWELTLCDVILELSDVAIDDELDILGEGWSKNWVGLRADDPTDLDQGGLRMM